jgi:hypothetical protein
MSTEITINQDIVEINVTEQVVTIEAPSGAYPLPSMVSSVFGRTGNVVAQEGDYTLTQLGGVTITSPTNNQVLKYNGTQWVNSSDTDTGLTSVGLSMPSAFSVANSPLTANGTLSVTGAGTTAQYVRGDGSLATFPVIAQEAQRLITEVYNSTGATLAKGTVVYINGGQGNLPTVTKAIATGDATSAQTYGVVQSDITNMNNGFVVAMGSLTNLDTQIYPVGTQLYLSATTAGAWTSVKQYAPNHLVYVGIVVRSHPTQGVVEIRIQNGYELDELHDVSAQSPTNGDILQYVAATDLWTKAAGTTTNIAEGTRLYFTDARARAAISLTTTGTSGASTYNNTTGVLNIPQYQSVLTNPVTGTGTTNTLPKFTGASTIGNSNVSDSGTVITLASFTNISSGTLAIGTSTFDGSIYITRNITGSGGNPNGIYQNSTIQSDANGSAYVNRTLISTQAASFTLVNLNHYYAEQGTFGAGSVVTNQTGFFARQSLIGATNNYGFRGAIPAATGNWNLFMNGTAANFLAGDTGIGTQTLGTATQLTIGGTETAVSAIARGQLINTTLVASANNDVLVGLDIAPTFTNGAFTGVANLGIRSTVPIAVNIAGGFYGGFITNSFRTTNAQNYSYTSHSPSSGVANQIYSGSRPATATTNGIVHYIATDNQVFWDTTNAPYNFLISGTQYLKLFNTTGNFTLQNGGTFTDAGFRLDVNGTTRLQGSTTITGSTTAASAIARGVNLTSTLVAAANNDVLVGLDIQPTFTNGGFTGVANAAIRIGNYSAGGGSNPSNIDLGASFSSTAGQNLKLKLFNTNTDRSALYGFGVSVGSLDYFSGGGNHSFYSNIGATLYMRLFGNGNLLLQNGGTFTDIASARLAVNSTTQGFLPPRMTTTEKNAIASPATGLVVFDTTLGKLCVFAGTWQTITSV